MKYCCVFDLQVSLKTVFKVSAGRVVGIKAETRLTSLPHACVLIQSALEFLHCCRSIKTNNLARDVMADNTTVSVSLFLLLFEGLDTPTHSKKKQMVL